MKLRKYALIHDLEGTDFIELDTPKCKEYWEKHESQAGEEFIGFAINLEDLRAWLKGAKPLLKPHYFVKNEMGFDRESANLQAVLGLQTCKTKGEACEILNDIRLHERIKLLASLGEDGEGK